MVARDKRKYLAASLIVNKSDISHSISEEIKECQGIKQQHPVEGLLIFIKLNCPVILIQSSLRGVVEQNY